MTEAVNKLCTVMIVRTMAVMTENVDADCDDDGGDSQEESRFVGDGHCRCQASSTEEEE